MSHIETTLDLAAEVQYANESQESNLFQVEGVNL